MIEPNLINTGVVIVQSGTLIFDDYYYGQNGILGGTFQADAGATLEFAEGGNLTGSFTSAAGGSIMLVGRHFHPRAHAGVQRPRHEHHERGDDYLDQRTIANLQLTGGTVVLTPTFQGGAITNLTLNGASLSGHQLVTGVLNLYGTLHGPLTVVSNATLNMNGSINAPLTLLPGATMNWSNGYSYDPLTIPSNAVLNVAGPGTSMSVRPADQRRHGQLERRLRLYTYYYYYYYYDGAFYNLAGATFNIQSNVSTAMEPAFLTMPAWSANGSPGAVPQLELQQYRRWWTCRPARCQMEGPIQNSNVGGGTYLAEAGRDPEFQRRRLPDRRVHGGRRRGPWISAAAPSPTRLPPFWTGSAPISSTGAL